MKRRYFQKKVIIQFVGGTIVLYIFLMSNVFHVGDTLFPPTEDYLSLPGEERTQGDTRLKDTDTSGITSNKMHGAAEYVTSCPNQTLCSTLSFV